MAKIVLGVTGSISAYKAADIIRAFRKKGHDVTCVMTSCAKEFITPLTLRTLSGNPVYEDMFFESKNPGSKVEHIGLAKNCDMILVAPATASIIGKTACGIADDLLSTVIMAAATGKKIAFAPAMNTQMWKNPVVAENVSKLKKLGYSFIGPKAGELACGDYGAGHIEDVGTVVAASLGLLKKKA